jgi:hypothetical protein
MTAPEHRTSNAALPAALQTTDPDLHRRHTMFRKSGITILTVGVLLTALNAAILVTQLSAPSKAAVGGMDAQALSRDPDFKRAVQTVVEACRVNVELGKVQC